MAIHWCKVATDGHWLLWWDATMVKVLRFGLTHSYIFIYSTVYIYIHIMHDIYICICLVKGTNSWPTFHRTPHGQRGETCRWILAGAEVTRQVDRRRHRPRQQIIERKALLKELQGLSGGQQNKDEERELHVSRSILCQSMVNSCLRARTRVLSTIEGYLKEDFDAWLL